MSLSWAVVRQPHWVGRHRGITWVTQSRASVVPPAWVLNKFDMLWGNLRTRWQIYEGHAALRVISTAPLCCRAAVLSQRAPGVLLALGGSRGWPTGVRSRRRIPVKPDPRNFRPGPRPHSERAAGLASSACSWQPLGLITHKQALLFSLRQAELPEDYDTIETVAE